MRRLARPRENVARDMSECVAIVQNLLDATPDALVVVDAGKIALVNRGAEGLLGYARQDLLGQPFVVLVAAEDREALLDVLVDAARSVGMEPGNAMVEVQARHKDGTEIPVEVSLNPLETEGRRLVLAAVRDIRARKRLEQERLELLAREREARLKAEVAVELRDTFLAAVTHDLMQPLTSISARAQLIDDLESELSDRGVAEVIHTSASKISASITLMTGALHELVDLARTQMGKPALRPRLPISD
jgi:protein-histidine pros-kinase